MAMDVALELQLRRAITPNVRTAEVLELYARKDLRRAPFDNDISVGR